MNCYAETLVPIYKKLGIDIKKMYCCMLNAEWDKEHADMIQSMFDSS